ncbi:hypothetical protein [Pyrococcus horikoshii]|uniref:Uncharacterized protein n=1 Tax=Pyrococcus horikoshii TaxID=53953 RepID=A0A832T9L8_PYRHR|nr:hypothetical protein [Pyrococcus horikoshii]HII61274.1 hypothetical protein [Pyrococcus horikoshii]
MSSITWFLLLAGAGFIAIQEDYKTLPVAFLTALIYWAVSYFRFGSKFSLFPIVMLFVGTILYLNSKNRKVMKIAGISEIIASLAFLILP